MTEDAEELRKEARRRLQQLVRAWINDGNPPGALLDEAKNFAGAADQRIADLVRDGKAETERQRRRDGRYQSQYEQESG